MARAWHSGERGFSVMGTQLNYAAWAQRAAPAPAPVTHASVPAAPALSSLRLLSPAHPPALLHLRDGAVVLYRRPGSLVWQVRFKLWDQRWHRCSTRHRDQHMAIRAAGDIYDRAKFCEASGVPLTTRRFGAVAALTLQALDTEIEQGVRPMSNRDYQRVINKYLVPFFGKYLLTSIDAALVREYEVWRNERMPLSNWLMWLVVSTNTACLVFSADLRLCCAALLKLSTASMTKQCRAHLGLHLNETVFTVDLWSQL